MMRRCYEADHHAFKHYGMRGIYVCDEWKEEAAFARWAELSGLRSGLFIDRIDNDGPYCPDNCRVVTPLGSAHNRRDNKRKQTSIGFLLHAEIARASGVSDAAISSRIKRGLTGDELLLPRAQARGAGIGVSKLTEEDVLAIRAARANGASQPQLAKMFSISQASAWAIVNRKTWKHV